MKILGYTDSRSECDLCGKSELKGVYVIELSCGRIMNVGSTCVTKSSLLNEDEFAEFKTYEKSINKIKREARSYAQSASRFSERKGFDRQKTYDFVFSGVFAMTYEAFKNNTKVDLIEFSKITSTKIK